MSAVTDYIEALPLPFSEMMGEARRLILELLPQAEEHIRYGIPFFYYYGPFIYMNVPKKNPCVEVAFVKGKYLSEHPDLAWRAVERKQVRSVEVSKPSDLEALRFLILEAAPLNEERHGWALNKGKQ